MMIMILAFLESCKLRRILIQVAPTRVMVWPPQIKGTYENYGISTLISISIQFTVSITFTLLSKYFIHIFFFTVEVEANFRPIYYIDVIHVPQVWIGGKFSTNIYKGPGSIRNPLNLLSVMTLNFVTEKKIVTKMSSLWILQATVLQSIRWVEYEWSWVWVHQSLKFFFIFALFFSGWKERISTCQIFTRTRWAFGHFYCSTEPSRYRLPWLFYRAYPSWRTDQKVSCMSCKI